MAQVLGSVRFSVLVGVAFATLAFALVSGVTALWLESRSETVVRTELRIRDLAGEVGRLDEVLTMSARMAAATGDPRWEERYHRNAPRLDDALAEITDLAPEAFVSGATAETQAANTVLVGIELRALDLARSGESAAATGLLLGAEYEAQKAVYARGMEKAMARLRERADARISTQRRTLALAAVFGFVAFGIIGTAWYQISRVLWFRVGHLDAVNESLEARVAERTVSLERERRAAIEAREVADRASAAKSVFLANMSHELRTPLNAIIGYTELVLEEGPDQGGAELQRVLAAARHLSAMVEDILDLSKIEAERMTFDREPIDVARLVAGTVDLLAAAAAADGLVVDVDVQRDALVMVGDAIRIRQCLANLLSNAVKFSPHGGRITIEVSGAADRVRFAVADGGAGIPPEKLAQLFQPFTQIDPSPTRRRDGAGLGLALTSRLCERMGGRVEVESELGRGSRFTLDLPRQAA